MAPSKEPCTFFARNACKAGHLCRFAHVQIPASQAPSPGLCQFFLRGNCTYGDKCFNIHSQQGQERSLAPSLTLCRFYLQGQCKNGSNCAFRHDQGPPSSVSPRPGSANSLATDTSSQLSPLKNFDMLQMRSMPASPSASPRPASSASLRVPAQTSDASVSEVSSSVDTDAGDRQETNENHVTGNWETMDNDAIPSADASASTENATSDMGQDTSSYHGNWETMDDTVRAPDVPANSINESEEFRHDEPPSASVNPPPTGFPPPFMMYAQPYYDPNLYAPASQSTQNNAPHPYHSYGVPASFSPFAHILTPSSQSQASSFATVSGDVAPCQQHFAYGSCPVGVACRFRHYLTDEEMQTLSFNSQNTQTLANNQQDSVIQKRTCFFWKTKAGCRNGDSCPYDHTIEQKIEPSSKADDFGWGTGPSDANWDVAEDPKESTDNSGWGTTASEWGATADDQNDENGWGVANPTSSWGETSTPSTPSSKSKSKYENDWGSAKRNNDGGRRGKDVVPRSKPTRSGETLGMDARHGRNTPPRQYGVRNRTNGWENESKPDSHPSVKDPSSPRARVGSFSADTSRWLDSDETLDGSKTPHDVHEPHNSVSVASPQGEPSLHPDCDERATDEFGVESKKQDAETEGSLERAQTFVQDCDERTTEEWEEEAKGEHEGGQLTTDNSPEDFVRDRQAMEEEEGREYVEGTDTPADHHGSLEEPDEEMEEWPAEEQEDGEGSIGEVKSTNEIYDGRTMEEGGGTEVVDSWQSSNGWNTVDDAWNEYQNEPRKTLPCKAFGQGHCRFGDNCHYLHIAPEAADDWQHDSGVTETVDAEEIAPIELEESLDEPLPIIRQSFYCDINYGQTTRPEKIVTSFESDTIRIYNIPLSFGEDDIFGLVSPFGTVLEMQTEFSEDPTYHATVKFSSQTEAEEAVKRLRDLELVTEHTLQVYLGSKAQIMYDWRPSAPGRSVKISYPNPSREAWVCFQTMDLYKKAGGLDGEMFGGRKIAVLKERRPPKNRNYYYLRVSGLPLAAGKQEIKAFFKDCMLVEMITPTYTTPPVNEIDALLQQHGELEELDMLPFSDEKPRNLGFARFASADAASRAIHALNNTSYAFLGGGNLRVQTTYYIAYHISRNILSVIRKELDRLCDSLTTGIQVYESVSTTSPVDSVVLRLCGSDLVAFTKTRRDLDLLTGGEVILMDGKPLWDDYFDLPSSTRIIEQLNSQGSFFIERDFRNRHILVFGQKARGEEMLLKLLNKVWEQIVTMAVSDACIANMIRAGYPDEVAAKNKVHFDYACRAITVRGTADDREKVWSAISEYEAYSEPVLSARERTCALCHSEPPEPISLPCRHTFCRGCLQLWFKSLIGPNFTSVECIAAVDSVPDASEKQEGEISRCCAQVPYAFIHEVLSDEEEDDLLEYSFLSHIWAHLLEFRLCPTRNCPMVYRVGSPGTVIQCPGCRKDICISCHGELHEGLTCTECKLL